MRLYHLLSSDYGLENIAKRRLKIAEIGDLNDPFELLAADGSDPSQREIWRRWRRDQERRWGTLCFSKTWQNPVLWSHYGDKHRGLALGFDVDDRNTIPIRYTKSRKVVDIFELQREGKLTESLMLQMMSTKFFDWRYEKEVRVYSSLNARDPVKGLFFYGFSESMRLREIIAGPSCSLSLEEIQSHLQPEDEGVSIKKSRLAFRSFKVVQQKRGFPGGNT